MKHGSINSYPRIKPNSITKTRRSLASFLTFHSFRQMSLLSLGNWLSTQNGKYFTQILHIYDAQLVRREVGFTTLRGFVIQRPSLRQEALGALLDLTTHPGVYTSLCRCIRGLTIQRCKNTCCGNQHCPSMGSWNPAYG
jgi:hypothetical protein